MSDDLVNKLINWEKVWPEDMDKTEGHLYYEAAERIEDLTRRHTHALHKIDVLEDQIEEIMLALEIADKWMTDLDMYADPDHHLAPSLQHVRDTFKKFKVSK